MFIGEEIFESKFWRVILGENQVHLGYTIVTLKRRGCGDLAGLTNDEMLDFRLLVKKLESGLRKAFNATMFNWSCLMNNAYQNIPPDPHVHWHCRPRYNNTPTFREHEFPDVSFGYHYDWPLPQILIDAGTRKAMVEEIQKYTR